MTPRPARTEQRSTATGLPTLRRFEGCRGWDLANEAFIVYAATGESTTLGYGHAAVCDAVDQTAYTGLTAASAIDIEQRVGEAMVRLIDSADTVAFGRTGNEAIAGAISVARAFTGRELVARCADQTACAPGAPSFRFNDLADANAMFGRFAGRIACVVLEAETNEAPATAYLHRLQTLCHEHDALLVLDESNTGFRWHDQGAQKLYNFRPDLSCFGTSMANGFPVSALCGKREMMRSVANQCDNRPACVGRSLSEFGGAPALAACLATLQVYREIDVITRLERQGNRLKRGLLQVIADGGLSDYLKISGRPQAMIYNTLDANRMPSAEFRSLFQDGLLARGIVAPNFIVSIAHDDTAIDQTIEAVAAILPEYRRALENENVGVSASGRRR